MEQFGPADIRKMAGTFLGEDGDGNPLPPPLDQDGNPLPPPVDEDGDPIEPWHALADTFVLCISRPLSSTQQDVAWRKVERRLKARGIKAELWDAEHINRMLKKAPEIVDDFFGRAWVTAFCGPEAAKALGEQVGSRDVEGLKQTLTRIKQEAEARQQAGVHLSEAGLEQLVVALRQGGGLSAAPVQEAGTGRDDPLSRALDRLGDLIIGGAFGLAKTRIEELRTQAEAATPEQHALFLRLEGQLLYRQHQPGADERYLRAYELDPKAESAGILKGLGHLLRGEPELALGFLHTAQEQFPHRDDARALYAHALHGLGKKAELDALEQGLTPDQDDLVLALARIHMEERDTAGMRRVLKTLEGGPHALKPEKRLLEAKATLLDLMRESEGQHGDLRARRVHENPEAQAALTTFSEILPVMQDPRHLRLLYREALNARKALYSLMGEEHLAVQDGLEELREDPHQPGVQYSLALSQLRLDHPQEALHLLEQYGEEVLDAHPQSRIIFAAAARHSGDPSWALALVAPLVAWPDEELRLEALEERVRALLAAGRVPEARSVVEAEPGPHVTVELTRALIESADGNDEAARQAYERALDLVREAQRVALTFQYARYLTAQRDWNTAADQLAQVDLNSLPDDWLESTIHTLYSGGRVSEARSALALRRSRGEPRQPETFEIEAHLAALEGDLAAAIPLYHQVLKRWPNRQHTLVALASALARLNRRREVEGLLQRLLDLPGADATPLMMGSEVATRLQLADLARKLAYAALRRGYDLEETHINMFNVLHAFPIREKFRIVRPETAVQLEEPGREPWWVVLTADPQPERARQEYALDDSLATHLLGKAVGTSVTLPSGASYTVKEVISKFENAERVYLQNNRQLFPVSGRTRMMQVSDLQVLPSGVWDLLRAQHEQGTEELRRVREQVTPVLALNAHRRWPESQFWDWLLENRVELKGSTFDTDEALAAGRAVQGGKLVLHTSALMVLGHAHLLRRVANGKGMTLYVTRHTLDDVRRAVAQARRDVKQGPRKTLYYADGRIILDEEEQEVAEERLRRLEGVERFIRKHTRVVPVLGLAELMEQFEEPDFLAPSFSTVLASRQLKAPLLCDDLGFLRMMAFPGLVDGAPSGLTSVMLVEALQAQGGLNADQSANAKLTLAGLGQTIVRLDREAIQQLFRRENLDYGPLTVGLVRNLTHPWLKLENVGRNLALLAQGVCLHAPLNFSRERWLRQALDQALGDRDLLAFRDAVLAALRGHHTLAVLYTPFLIDVVERWTEDRWRVTGGRSLTPVT